MSIYDQIADLIMSSGEANETYDASDRGIVTMSGSRKAAVWFKSRRLDGYAVNLDASSGVAEVVHQGPLAFIIKAHPDATVLWMLEPPKKSKKDSRTHYENLEALALAAVRFRDALKRLPHRVVSDAFSAEWERFQAAIDEVETEP